MVYVQDFMGQYDAYLNGANTLINKLNDIISNMARNVS
jgi:hypothetical protein